MLICKNCDSENIDGVTRCNNCQMEDNFIYVRPGESKAVVIEVDQNPLSCPNCACKSPGSGNKCVECHFPIARNKKANGTPILKSQGPYGILDEEDLKQLN